MMQQAASEGLSILASTTDFFRMLSGLLHPLLKDRKRRGWALLWTILHVGGEWFDTALHVRVSFFQRAYMTALQKRDTRAFYRNLTAWLFGQVAVGWTLLFKDSFRQQLILLWHRSLLDHMVTVCFDWRGLLQIRRGGCSLDNVEQRICVASKELVVKTMWIFVLFNRSLANLIQYSRILNDIRPELLVALAGNGAVGVLVALRCFASWLHQVTDKEAECSGHFLRSIVRADQRAEDIALCSSEPFERRFVDRRLAFWFRSRWVCLFASKVQEAWNSVYKVTLTAIPYLLTAAAYFEDRVDFGAITQATHAFWMVHEQTAGIIASNLNLWAETSMNAYRAHSILDLFRPTGIISPDLQSTARGSTLTSPEDVVLDCGNVAVAAPQVPMSLLVKNLSFRLCRQEALLVVGPSGVGKTSLLRTLVGVWPPAGGRITCAFDQGDVMFMPQTPLMAPQGSWFQQVLYPRLEASDVTASDCIPKELRLHAIDGLRAAELAPVIVRSGVVAGDDDESVYQNLEKVSTQDDGEWVSQLSPGEQQRIAFGRAFAQKPKLVLLDEATSALDLELECKMYTRLRQMGCTVISIAHRPSLLRFHTHVLEMSAAGAAIGGCNLFRAEDYTWNTDFSS